MANADVSAAMISPGARLRAALTAERPLQVVGAINAYAARMAAACGFQALYLSGGGVAANSLGGPDLGDRPRPQLSRRKQVAEARTDLRLHGSTARAAEAQLQAPPQALSWLVAPRSGRLRGCSHP